MYRLSHKRYAGLGIRSNDDDDEVDSDDDSDDDSGREEDAGQPLWYGAGPWGLDASLLGRHQQQ